jgi:predicted dehydrogenase
MPHHLTDATVCVLGSGLMAQAYVKVLQAQGRDFHVIGRGEASAAKFRAETGVDVATGGIETWLDRHGAAPSIAVVAVNLPELTGVSVRLLEAGTKRLLIEKPGSLERHGLDAIQQAANESCAEVSIAYNRRFFASTLAAEAIIQDDGGPTSFQFEFTEWPHRIGIGSRNPRELAAWFFVNSSHVVDLAFHLGGQPAQLSAWTGGSLPWHPSGSIFCGAGRTERGALFSYQANWQSPGRWNLELLTRKHRLHLRPLEALGLQENGSLEIKSVPIDDVLDREFKPGIYRQVEAFLDRVGEHRLPTLEEHVRFWDSVLEVIAPSQSLGVANAA